ncbi:MAG: DNA-directed RNA polymerase subunit alpha C-terminal domain-containing protein [Rhodomicrobium sp.]
MSIITLESKIEELNLSKQASECLKNAGIVYVGDILRMAGAHLRVYCDQPAFCEIKKTLAGHGLHIGEELSG